MVHTDKLNVNDLLKEFYLIQDISSNEGLPLGMLRTVTADYISFLELKGFVKLKAQPVYFCD